MAKEMRMHVWRELGKEVSMEMGQGEKEEEQGDEDGDEDVAEDGDGRRRCRNRWGEGG